MGDKSLPQGLGNGPLARSPRRIGTTSLRDWLWRREARTEITATVRAVADLTLYLPGTREGGPGGEDGAPVVTIELALPGGAADGRAYVLLGTLTAVRRVEGETTTTIPALLRALFGLDPASPVWTEEWREDI